MIDRQSTEEEVELETNRLGLRAMDLIDIIWSNPGDLETQAALSDAIGWEPTPEDLAIQMTARLCLKVATIAAEQDCSLDVAARVMAMMVADRHPR